MLTQERLKDVLTYDPETGLFTRNYTVSGPNGKIGSQVGTINSCGYLNCRVDTKTYKLHRLAFLYMMGYFPKEVDHIDGIIINNRWCNLRECTRTQNRQNLKKAVATNKTGYLGVYPHKNGTFVAQIQIGNKQVYLGLFRTPELAYASYLEAKRKNHEFNTL